MAEKRINRQMIINLLSSYGIEVNKDIENIYPELSKNFFEDTKNLCQLYLKLLNEDSSAAYALGANIIFNLRKIVMKKDIIMYIGGTDINNANLKITQINLTELLNNPTTFKITKDALELQSQIENYEKLQKKVNRDQSTVQKKILDSSQLTGHGDFTTKEQDDQIYTKSGDKRPLYRRNKIDRNVYYGYAGTNILSYYLINKNDYQFFNKGWLFEHFTKKQFNLNNEQRKQQVIDIYASENPLKGVIGSMDNIPGQKGGDFQYNNKEYQVKYGNQQIITKNSIEKVMKQIIFSLDQLKSDKGIIKNLKPIFEVNEDKLDKMLNQVDESIESIIRKNLTT